MIIRCIDSSRRGYQHACANNARLENIEDWLRGYASNRWVDWNWHDYGCIEFRNPESEIATAFKLTFGL
jgi:hypothetical protein